MGWPTALLRRAQGTRVVLRDRMQLGRATGLYLPQRTVTPPHLG